MTARNRSIPSRTNDFDLASNLIMVITAPTLRLDLEPDRRSVALTVSSFGHGYSFSTPSCGCTASTRTPAVRWPCFLPTAGICLARSSSTMPRRQARPCQAPRVPRQGLISPAASLAKELWDVARVAGPPTSLHRPSPLRERTLPLLGGIFGELTSEMSRPGRPSAAAPTPRMVARKLRLSQKGCRESSRLKNMP